MYITGHPLDAYEDYIKSYSNISSNDLSVEEPSITEENEKVENSNAQNLDGKQVNFIGIITSIRTKITKNNEIMAFVSIEDLHGTINAIAFPKTYATFRDVFKEDNIVKVVGRVNAKEDEISVAITKIAPFELENQSASDAETTSENKYSDKNIVKLTIPKDKTEDELKVLREVIKTITNQKGNMNIEIINGENRKTFRTYMDDDVFETLRNASWNRKRYYSACMKNIFVGAILIARKFAIKQN